MTKAPSGRELDFAKQKTEGERVTIMLVQTQSHACSFRHAIACHLSLRLGHISALALSTQFTTEMPLRYLPEEGLGLVPLVRGIFVLERCRLKRAEVFGKELCSKMKIFVLTFLWTGCIII